MRLLAAGVLLAAVAGRALPAAADPASTARLQEAGAALAAGDHARAAGLAGPLTSAPGLDRADRSQAWRVYGLALFMGNRLAEAEAAVLEHLALEPDAHLDPASYPPEVIVFFEDVRARHAAEIAGQRARPATARERLKNFLPPWGQVQNRHRGKALVIGVAELTFLAANVASAVMLYRWCDQASGVCRSGDDSRRDEAIRMRQVNIASLALLAAVVIYGAIDAEVYYRRGQRAETAYISLGVDASAGAGELALTWAF